jgi:hypothetical protein
MSTNYEALHCATSSILLLGRAMAQAVSHRAFTAKARVNPCGTCGGQSGTGTRFTPSSSVPLSVSFHRRSPHSYHLEDEQYVRQWQHFRDVVSSHRNQSIILLLHHSSFVQIFSLELCSVLLGLHNFSVCTLWRSTHLHTTIQLS